MRKEGGAQSLLFTMNHCRFWKILLLNIRLPHPLKLSLREAKELFSDNITGRKQQRKDNRMATEKLLG